MADEATTWVTLRHEETGGTTRIPALDDVIAMHESRGWVQVEEDAPEVCERYVAPDGEVPEWVEMTHPDLPAGLQRVPNHPDALAGQLAAGWALPTEAAGVKRRKPKETPAADAGNNDAAGDGTNEKE